MQIKVMKCSSHHKWPSNIDKGIILLSKKCVVLIMNWITQHLYGMEINMNFLKNILEHCIYIRIYLDVFKEMYVQVNKDKM